jgi:hypothetical protein
MPAGAIPVDWRVGRLVGKQGELGMLRLKHLDRALRHEELLERAAWKAVNASPPTERDDFYYDDASEPDEPVCAHCSGDGMDPLTDYLLPCKHCQGGQRP